MVCVKARGGYLRLKSQYITSIPVPENISNEKLKTHVESIMRYSYEEKLVSEQFTQLLQTKYSTININNKLQSWYTLTANDFLKELSKQKIKLSLAEQQEWLQYFEEQKTKANTIQQVIQQTDMEIDAMVYQLYELTDDEIKIVEGK
jgi:type II restriction/modification system DNA methylase subunit YeeA